MPFPTRVGELPEGLFYAILRPESVAIPGDERSRTNPGHGYPEHTESYWSLETFANDAEWKKEIERICRSGLKEDFKAVICKVAKIERTVEININ